MEWIISNWYFIVIGFALLICVIAYIRNQKININEWLKIAVAEAEKELGGGTGQLKLRYVYDMALAKFHWLAIIPFSTFSKWVEKILEWLNKQLSENDKLNQYIKK